MPLCLGRDFPTFVLKDVIDSWCRLSVARLT